YFYFKSLVESDPKTVQMRKTVFQADQLRKAGEREQALEKYREAIPVLRDILLAHREFRRDPLVQEDAYTIAMDARQLFADLYGKRIPYLAVVGDYLGQLAMRSAIPLPCTPPALA